MRTSSSTSTSESNIVFFSAGGHSHDGSDSSLIDGSKYSIYDFDQGFIPTNTQRAQNQQKNKTIFVDSVKDILRTAGVELGENVIKSENIIAGSITADLLSTDAVKSRNYVDNSAAVFPESIIYSNTGTFIDLATGQIQTPNFGLRDNGAAYFRGELQAASGTFGGFIINSSGISSETVFTAEIDLPGELDPGLGKANTEGQIDINNYGDIRIKSTASDGPYAGLYHTTFLMGEYIIINKSSNSYVPDNNTYAFFGGVGNSVPETDDYKALVRNPFTYSLLRSTSGYSSIESNFEDSANISYQSAFMTATQSRAKFELFTGEIDYNIVFSASTDNGGKVSIGNHTLPSSGANGPYYVGQMDLYANGHIYSYEDVQFAQRTRFKWGILLASNNGVGDSILEFYDYTNNAWRSLIWDDSSSHFAAEEDNGTKYKILTSRDIGSTVKSFVINHPLDKNRYLVHAATEGPTSDVFYRGSGVVKNGVGLVKLPDYFNELTEDKGVTVHLTPISDGPVNYILSASPVENGHFFVYSSNREIEHKFYWRVDAIRKHTNFEVEPLKRDVVLHGHGPYTYLT